MRIFSEQQIVDCSTVTGNYGCSGGSLRNTLKYLDKSGGLMTSIDYPYIAKVRTYNLSLFSLFLIIQFFNICSRKDVNSIKVKQ